MKEFQYIKLKHKKIINRQEDYNGTYFGIEDRFHMEGKLRK